MSEQKLKIGITQGDTNGIGWEVILKALADPRMTELFTPVVYGSPKAAAYYRNTLAQTEPVQFNAVTSARDARRGKVNLVACGDTEQIEPGKASAEAGRAAVEALPRDAGAEGGAARRHRHGPLQQGERAGRRVPLHGPYRIHRGRTGRGADDDHVQRDSARGAGHQAHSGVGDQRQHHRGEDRARPAYAPPHAERGLRHRRAAHRRDGSQPACRGRRTAGTRGAGDHPPGRRRGVQSGRAGVPDRLPPTGFSQAEDTQNTTAYWPCTTIRGWRRSRRFRPTA